MKKVMLLEDNLGLCSLLNQMFNGFGVTEITTFHNYEDVTGLTKEQLNFEIVFLDVNLGVNQKTGIDAFDWLIQNDYKGKIVFFTGHAGSYGLLKKINENPNVHLLEKPAEISALKSFFEK